MVRLLYCTSAFLWMQVAGHGSYPHSETELDYVTLFILRSLSLKQITFILTNCKGRLMREVARQVTKEVVYNQSMECEKPMKMYTKWAKDKDGIVREIGEINAGNLLNKMLQKEDQW